MKMLISKPIEILTGKSKSKSHWSLVLDTLFIIIYLFSKPSVAWDKDHIKHHYPPRSRPLAIKITTVIFAPEAWKTAARRCQNTTRHWRMETRIPRIARLERCHASFASTIFFSEANILKKLVKGSLKWTSGQWLNDPQILVSFNPWHHTQGLWFKFKSCQHIEEAEGAVGAYRVAKIAVTSRGARAGGLVNK